MYHIALADLYLWFRIKSEINEYSGKMKCLTILQHVVRISSRRLSSFHYETLPTHVVASHRSSAAWQSPTKRENLPA